MVPASVPPPANTRLIASMRSRSCSKVRAVAIHSKTRCRAITWPVPVECTVITSSPNQASPSRMIFCASLSSLRTLRQVRRNDASFGDQFEILSKNARAEFHGSVEIESSDGAAALPGCAGIVSGSPDIRDGRRGEGMDGIHLCDCFLVQRLMFAWGESECGRSRSGLSSCRSSRPRELRNSWRGRTRMCGSGSWIGCRRGPACACVG